MIENTTFAPTALTQNPSGFGVPAGMRTGMPVCGHAAGSALTAAVAISGSTTGAVVRDRQLAGKAYLPGTSAWRPPTC